MEIIDVDSDVDMPPPKRVAIDSVRALARQMHIDVDGPGFENVASRLVRPRRAFVNSAPLFREACMLHSERNQTILELNTPRTHAEVSSDPRYQTRITSGTIAYRRYCEALESFGMKRTFLQAMMHDLAGNIMASLLYGDEWDTDRARIMEENNWRDLPPLMASISARRYGKTVGAAQQGGATMLSKGAHVGCFAPSIRQSLSIMEECWRLLNRSPMFAEYTVERVRAVEIVIVAPNGEKSSLRAYPSTHKVIPRERRGVGHGTTTGTFIGVRFPCLPHRAQYSVVAQQIHRQCVRLRFQRRAQLAAAGGWPCRVWARCGRARTKCGRPRQSRS